MNPDIFSNPVVATLGPVPVTPTMLTSAVLSLLLVLAAAWTARGVVHRPQSRLAAAGRLLFRFLADLVSQSCGQRQPMVEVFAGTLFLFIAGSGVLGQLPGVRTPTSSLPATAALAVLVFLAVHVAGIWTLGVGGHLKDYLTPNPLLFPLHVVNEVSRTLALALRLFGNMMSGQLIVALLVALAGLFIPVPLMILDLLIGFLQAYIFTILASVYIGAAIRRGEEKS